MLVEAFMRAVNIHLQYPSKDKSKNKKDAFLYASFIMPFIYLAILGKFALVCRHEIHLKE